MPADLNSASLLVSAIDTIYELDLSSEQLRTLRAQALGTASTAARKPAKPDPKLAAALQDLETALLEAKDDEAIAKARNQVIEQSAAEEPPLDDEIHATAAARSKASAFFTTIKPSQIAAYLAAHADEVGDPVEMMTDALISLRSGKEKDAGGNNPDAVEESTALIQEVSLKVSALVAGTDAAQNKQVADQVSAWLTANYELNDEAYAARQAALEASAAKIAGNVSNMTLLQHWLENQMALLMSNPQLHAALDAIDASRR